MKTLLAFWAYFDGEKPDVAKAWTLSGDELTPLAQCALSWAVTIICEHIEMDTSDEDEQAVIALRHHPAALRDLSLTLCDALAKMREQVPVATWSDKRDGMAGYVRAMDNETGIMTISTEPISPVGPGDPRRFSSSNERYQWAASRRTLVVFADKFRSNLDCDKLRGLDPCSISIRGKEEDCNPEVLAYLLGQIIAPMADCAAINTPDERMGERCKDYFG